MKTLKLRKSPKGLFVGFTPDALIGQLYDTIIFRKVGHKTVVLNSGGWRTMHTKKCINLICSELNLPISVQQVKGNWQVNLPDDVVLPFVDGIEINLA